MYVYIFICIYIYVHVCMYIHIYVHICIYINIHMYAYDTYTHTASPKMALYPMKRAPHSIKTSSSQNNTSPYAYVCSIYCINICVYICTYIYVYIHTYVYVYICIYVCIHICILNNDSASAYQHYSSYNKEDHDE